MAKLIEKYNLDEDFKPIRIMPGFDEFYFRELLISLTDEDVSDIHIETNMPIWIRRFGEQRRFTEREMTSHEMTKIVSWLYQSSNAMGELAKVHDINKKYSAIDEHVNVYSYRLNAVSSEQTMGSAVRIALRPIPRNLPTLENQIDLDPAIREAFIHSRGIGFIVGETGNGKSTLLAALNRDLLLNAPNRKLLTWESPIEFDLFSLNKDAPSSHVSQHEIGTSVKTFYDGVVNSLRSAPTDILVGESKDRVTLDATLHSGETGHKTNTTIHAGSVRDTFLRIASEYPPAEQAGVIYKTLVNVNFILVQKLLERPEGGRRYPLREWFVFDDMSRRELLAFDDIKAALTRLDQMVREKGQDFYTQSVKAYKDGKITHEAAKTFDFEMRQVNDINQKKQSGLFQPTDVSYIKSPEIKNDSSDIARTIHSGINRIVSAINGFTKPDVTGSRGNSDSSRSDGRYVGSNLEHASTHAHQGNSPSSRRKFGAPSSRDDATKSGSAGSSLSGQAGSARGNNVDGTTNEPSQRTVAGESTDDAIARENEEPTGAIEQIQSTDSLLNSKASFSKRRADWNERFMHRLNSVSTDNESP